jgi:ATP/maltotriose-dependent transcriptional regulator MalT
MHDAARTYFVGALDLARSAGDRALGGKVLAIMSHQANFLGRHAEALDLAQAAKSGAAGVAPPRVHAMYCAMEARALSSTGDEMAATRAVREAESAFARQGGEDEPPWIRYFDVAELHDEFGHCFRDLGRAEESARNLGIALDTSSAAYPRSRTFSRLVLASTRLQKGEVDEAAHDAVSAMNSLGSLRSARICSYVQDLASGFDRVGDCAATRQFKRHATTLLVG